MMGPAQCTASPVHGAHHCRMPAATCVEIHVPPQNLKRSWSMPARAASIVRTFRRTFAQVPDVRGDAELEGVHGQRERRGEGRLPRVHPSGSATRPPAVWYPNLRKGCGRCIRHHCCSPKQHAHLQRPLLDTSRALLVEGRTRCPDTTVPDEHAVARLQVSGQSVYSKLKFESGVHRVQRVPATESSGRVHTSTATVAVMPEVDDVDVQIDPKVRSLLVSTWMAAQQDSGFQPYAASSQAPDVRDADLELAACAVTGLSPSCTFLRGTAT